MIPKLKAKELVDKFKYISYDLDDIENHKEGAKIAVEEILESQPRYPSDVDWDDAGGTHQYFYEAQRDEAEKYWKEVLKEIDKL